MTISITDIVTQTKQTEEQDSEKVDAFLAAQGVKNPDEDVRANTLDLLNALENASNTEIEEIKAACEKEKAAQKAESEAETEKKVTETRRETRKFYCIAVGAAGVVLAAFALYIGIRFF